MPTPEGTIKGRLDRLLKERDVWRYSPQAGPYGASGVPDRLVLCRGELVGIECKADASKKPTALQEATMREIEKHGGKCFVVYDKATIDKAIAHIDWILGVHV